MNSGKHAHGKSISSINQRRGSGMGFSNSNPSTIVVSNTVANPPNNPHNSNNSGSTSNLNKSYQQNAPKYHNQNDHKSSSTNLQAGGKSLKKNMSFLANANPLPQN